MLEEKTFKSRSVEIDKMYFTKEIAKTNSKEIQTPDIPGGQKCSSMDKTKTRVL